MDWRGLMIAGLVRLRLRPDDFWALTPAELQMMLGLEKADAPLPRAALDAMLASYPDCTKDDADG